MPALIDSFGRHIDYLRVSVTEHCNYRCFYCRPGCDANPGNRRNFLTNDELVHLVRLFSELGVSKVRITGGEPLLRYRLAEFVTLLGRLPGLSDISLSTNGHLLAGVAVPLRLAGVHRINISLDSIEAGNFSRITHGGDLDRVLHGIKAAQAAGMSPVKINMVVMKGINEHEIEAMLDFAMLQGLELRFIETMPVGEAGLAAMDHYYPAPQILERVRERFGSQLNPVKGGKGAGPARYYQVGEGPVRIGIISALSRHFCSGCNRVRLTTKGDLVLCLGHENRVLLGAELRNGRSDTELKERILAAIASKPERHDFQSDTMHALSMNSMSKLGG
ncbi:MAG: GTP 3',8-cyclase MoaA [Thiogranum sp.]